MAKKLLLADDSITIQKVVGITLANEDVEITSVDNGEDAVSRAKQIRPDLVLADASMPRRDGYQVAEALKGDPSTSGIPVLILAGQLEGHPDPARLSSSRADGFIPKPFQSQELIDRVRKVLGLSGPVSIPVPRSATQPAGPGAVRPTGPAPVRPASVPTPAARPAASPMSQTMRSAQAPLAAAAAQRPAPSAINENDFSDLSSTPAASGDPDLWGDAAPVQTAPDPNLWTSTGNTDGNGVKSPEIVTNKAELANLERFEMDSSPSGLEVDHAAAKKPAPRTGDEMTSEPTGEIPREGGIPTGAIHAAIKDIPQEKLEQIVREVAREILKPILERIAWEVVPDLAEDIIKDEIKRLTQ